MKTTASVAAILAAFAVAPALAAQDAAGQDATQQQQPATQPAADLDTFARDAIASQQIAILATDKHTGAAVELLGDRIALTQGRLNQALDGLARQEGVELPARMAEADMKAMESMTDVNQDAFAERFLSWVGQSYPRMITTLEGWQGGDQQARAGIARTFLPELREQLQAARTIEKQGYNSQQAMDMLERGLEIERKDAPEIAPPGPATEGQDGRGG